MSKINFANMVRTRWGREGTMMEEMQNSPLTPPPQSHVLFFLRNKQLYYTYNLFYLKE
jgi:hypothetical protein